MRDFIALDKGLILRVSDIVAVTQSGSNRVYLRGEVNSWYNVTDADIAVLRKRLVNR